jgi:hypothetical protein
VSQRVSSAWVWLCCELAGRKWIVWVALLCLLAVAFQIGVALLPHHVLNTMLELEEKSNGIREFPNGVREGPVTTSR